MTNLFKGPAPPPPPPAPQPAPAMPDPNSPTALAARQKQIQQLTAGGRQATILTTTGARAGNTLAGGYGGQKLG